MEIPKLSGEKIMKKELCGIPSFEGMTKGRYKK